MTWISNFGFLQNYSRTFTPWTSKQFYKIFQQSFRIFTCAFLNDFFQRTFGPNRRGFFKEFLYSKYLDYLEVIVQGLRLIVKFSQDLSKTFRLTTSGFFKDPLTVDL